MGAYQGLAPFYDGLTKDVDYAAFADFYEAVFKALGVRPGTVLDLACGTGTLTCLLAERGYEMIAADRSAEMLAVAAGKAQEGRAAVRPVFLNQAMEELDLYGTVDAAVCALDGINYLKAELLPEVFRRLHLFIEPGGMLLFDVHTPEHLRALDGEAFVDENDEVYCVWRAEFSEEENACFYGMDLFFPAGGLWQRAFEEHVEYAHGYGALKALLQDAGFENVRAYGDLTLSPPGPADGRIFIAAQNGPAGFVKAGRGM